MSKFMKLTKRGLELAITVDTQRNEIRQLKEIIANIKRYLTENDCDPDCEPECECTTEQERLMCGIAKALYKIDMVTDNSDTCCSCGKRPATTGNDDGQYCEVCAEGLEVEV